MKARQWLSALWLCAAGCSQASTPEQGSCLTPRQGLALSGSLELADTKDRASVGPILLEVYEGSSVISCEDGLATSVSPGSRVKQWALSAPGPFSFTFKGDVEESFEMSAVLDENDNGNCDEGELSTYVIVGGVNDLSGVQLTLDGTTCPHRL